MKMKHRSVNGVGVVQSEYDYSEELSKPCNDNEHDIFWNGIQIRINITNGYIPNVINHFEIYCARPNHVTETAYRSYFTKLDLSDVEQVKAHVLKEFGPEPEQTSLF